MGICDPCRKPNIPFQPSNLNEIQVLYTYESAICKIKFTKKENGKIFNCIGTGFFCEINDNDIPFKKAFFTNNHILNKSQIEVNKEIKFEYLNNLETMKITKNRRTFTNEELDYTCIEILDSDKINKFFKIDKEYFKNKEIFILSKYQNIQKEIYPFLLVK